MRTFNSQSNQGVSPVVGVILVVAITVILSAVIGSFVLDLGNSVSDSEGNSDLGVSIEQTSDGGAEVQVVTGNAESVRVLVDGNEVATGSNLKPGDTISVPPMEPNSELSIVSSEGGEDTLVTTRTVSGSSDSSVTFDASSIEFCQDGTCA